jgi:hypothetical protein
MRRIGSGSSLAFDEHKIVDPYFNKTVMVRGDKAMVTH